MENRARSPDFRPLPLLGNTHVQTLLGNFWPGRVLRFATREEHVRLPDGDRLVLHESLPEGWQPGRRTAVLVHGLGGCHRSGYMMRMAGLLVSQGLRVI